MERVALAPLTTLKLGGPAARLVPARTEAELAEAVRSAYEPLLVLAGGSNVVIADDGFPGTVVRVLTRGVERDGDAVGPVIDADRLDRLRHVLPVGADVLDRRGAGGTGDAGQALDA